MKKSAAIKTLFVDIGRVLLTNGCRDHYALDITRARMLLGWEPKRSLRDTIPKMVKALKADPAKFCEENKLGEPPAPVEEKQHEAAVSAPA